MAAEEYDFIVVGAGTAGCVIAARLSENPRYRILLLEAGPADRNIWIHVPLGYGKTLANPALNWQYRTVPQPHIDNRVLNWPRGKGLGGSSSINGLLYVRGQHADYNRWAADGNEGWSYRDVLPYFRRAEDSFLGQGEFHGAGGSYSVEKAAWRNALSDAYIRAAVEAGIPANEDCNGATQEGVGYYHQTTRRGLRVSAATAYLRQAERRPNLRIITHALATGIRFTGRRATGVIYEARGKPQQALARREIILCGGTVNTPQLLQLSGIGPAAFLRTKGIAPVHDLKGVGENLQDHYAVNSLYHSSRPITLNDSMNSLLGRMRIGLEYILFRSGPLTMAAGTVGIFARSSPAEPAPDIQISYAPFTAGKFGGPLHSFSAFRSSVYQMRPQSRGQIRIDTANPYRPPVIHGNYLAAEPDRQTIVAALRLVRRISASPALQDFIRGEFQPGQEIQTDDEFLAYARARGGSSFHPVGSCRMGSDEMSVVDSRLRLHGCEGLRVADGSIMPHLVSGNTNAACLMIGEKCADLIKTAHGG